MAMQQKVSRKGRSQRTMERDLRTAHPREDSRTGKKITRATGRKIEFSHKTTIQLSGDTKSDLDRVKQEAEADTYEDVIRFLLQERKKNRPSAFGLLSGVRSFVRDEEEDSHRIRH